MMYRNTLHLTFNNYLIDEFHSANIELYPLILILWAHLFYPFLQNVKKNYDQDMDTLTKQQKQLVEKAETAQQIDMKGAAKRIKIEQVRTE